MGSANSEEKNRLPRVGALRRGLRVTDNVGMPSVPSPSLPEPRADWQYVLRAAWNVVNLSSVLGALIAAAGRARLRPGSRRLLLAEGYRFGFPPAGAFTVGSVVITRHTVEQLETWHPGTFDHEDTHAWQWTALIGLPYLPVYWVLCAWSWLRTGDPASRNFFERQAGLTRGGYVERPATNAGLRTIGRFLRANRKPSSNT